MDTQSIRYFGQKVRAKFVQKNSKSDKFVMGGELELMGIPGLLKGSNE